MAKHKSVKWMLENPSLIEPLDIANYAVMNSSDNDREKTTKIIELIIAYSKTIEIIEANEPKYRDPEDFDF